MKTHNFIFGKEEKMKQFKKFFLVLISSVTIGLIAGMAIPNVNAKESGQWAQVCCGTACGTDYCLGSGPYTCCK